MAETQPAASSAVLLISESERLIEIENEKKRKVLAALYQLNKKLRKTVTQSAKMQAERAGLEDSIQRLEERLSVLDESSVKMKAKLSERLKVIYRLSGFSIARVFSTAKNASEIDRDLKILGLIAVRDRNLVREYQAIQGEIKNKKQYLAGRLENLKNLEQQFALQEAELARELKIKNRILDGIKRKKLFAEKNLQELRQKSFASESIDDATLDVLFRPSFAKEKGQLQMPVEGKVSIKFGTEKSKLQPWSLFNKGIYIETKRDQEVRAVFDGKVAWSGFIPGQGFATVIDHGDHYYSVYSKLAAAPLALGEEVKKSQIIARLASEQVDDKAALYFEIRHFSEPYDPQLWLKGTQQ
jgi:murein hydrolase activator